MPAFSRRSVTSSPVDRPDLKRGFQRPEGLLNIGKFPIAQDELLSADLATGGLHDELAVYPVFEPSGLFVRRETVKPLAVSSRRLMR